MKTSKSKLESMDKVETSLNPKFKKKAHDILKKMGFKLEKYGRHYIPVLNELD
jgi:hypothetical protein